MRHGVQSWISWPEREAERRVENVHRRRRLLPSRSLPAHNGTQGPQGMHQHDRVRVKRIPYQQLFLVNFDSSILDFSAETRPPLKRLNNWRSPTFWTTSPHPSTQGRVGEDQDRYSHFGNYFPIYASEMQVHGPKVAHPDLASLVTRNIFLDC